MEGEVGTAEWNRSQSQALNAHFARQKAERIHDYLLREGDRMDPNTRRDLMQSAEWQDKIADAIEERFEIKRGRREELAAANQDAIVKAEAEIYKADAKGEQMQDEAARKHLDTLEERYSELERVYSDPKGEADETGRERILRTMARNRVMQARLMGEDVSPEEVMVGIRVEMGELTPEEAEEELAALQGG
jgi:hypothetical protein